MRSENRILFIIFLMMMAQPFISGYQDNVSVGSSTWTGTITGSRTMVVNLSGTSFHSLMWSLDAGAVITVELGVKSRDGGIWATPSGVGPFIVVGGVAQIEPLFLPVAEKIRITITGTTTGTVSFVSS